MTFDFNAGGSIGANAFSSATGSIDPATYTTLVAAETQHETAHLSAGGRQYSTAPSRHSPPSSFHDKMASQEAKQVQAKPESSKSSWLCCLTCGDRSESHSLPEPDEHTPILTHQVITTPPPRTNLQNSLRSQLESSSEKAVKEGSDIGIADGSHKGSDQGSDKTESHEKTTSVSNNAT